MWPLPNPSLTLPCSPRPHRAFSCSGSNLGRQFFVGKASPYLLLILPCPPCFALILIWLECVFGEILTLSVHCSMLNLRILPCSGSSNKQCLTGKSLPSPSPALPCLHPPPENKCCSHPSLSPLSSPSHGGKLIPALL